RKLTDENEGVDQDTLGELSAVGCTNGNRNEKDTTGGDVLEDDEDQDADHGHLDAADKSPISASPTTEKKRTATPGPASSSSNTTTTRIGKSQSGGSSSSSTKASSSTSPASSLASSGGAPIDIDTFYPRCFNLSCDTDTFIEDFKRGKCLAILKSFLVLEGEQGGIAESAVEAALEALERKLKPLDDCIEDHTSGTDYRKIRDDDWIAIRDVNLDNPAKDLPK
ncbi:unnamed protein product, partial [Amoebophrya sp. A25]